jgi:uncharacterized protein YndB with AHSA1/START domain
MSENRRQLSVPPDQVWKVLSDGWLYPVWVVGASRMREVDDTWPQVGSRLHHSVGVWPALLDDYTEVLETEPSRRLVLRARAWPAGEATVVMELAPADGGTEVTMREDATSGPATLLPEPVRNAQLTWRNTESLRRLAYIAEHRR